MRDVARSERERHPARVALFRLRAFFADEYTWLGVYLVVVAIATVVCVGKTCNNFLIFRAAFEHVVRGVNLYVPHPAEHADLFKYSPTFALLFAPFAVLPYAWALLAWNLLNVMLLYWAVRLVMPPRERLAAVQLTGIGLVTTIDGTQSNGLVAALMILAFAALERERIAMAASTLVIGALVKIFPLAAGAFMLPRRDRGRVAALGLVVGAALVLLPLLVTPGATLIAQYRSWYAMGATDALDRGASVMRVLHRFAGYDGPNWPIQLIGMLLLLMPVLVRRSRWTHPEFRRNFLASVLVYSVVFNHKAEQPSFIIALTGVAIWYAGSPRSGMWDILAGATFAATVPVFMTVVAPGLIADTVDGPLLVTATCCTAVWLVMLAELLDLVPDRLLASDPPELSTAAVLARDASLN